jgi:hypothetical protein
MVEAVKGEGETFDDLLQDLLEDAYCDDKFYPEIEQRWKTEERVSGVGVLREAGVS